MPRKKSLNDRGQHTHSRVRHSRRPAMQPPAGTLPDNPAGKEHPDTAQSPYGRRFWNRRYGEDARIGPRHRSQIATAEITRWQAAGGHTAAQQRQIETPRCEAGRVDIDGRDLATGAGDARYPTSSRIAEPTGLGTIRCRRSTGSPDKVRAVLITNGGIGEGEFAETRIPISDKGVDLQAIDYRGSAGLAIRILTGWFAVSGNRLCASARDSRRDPLAPRT